MIIDCLAKAIFMFLVYNIVSILLFGIPHSLSMTYYLFKNRKEILKVLFPSMIMLMTIFLLPCWLQISDGSDFQFTAFLSMASLMFVGACPTFLTAGLENKVHYISAIICAVFALLWIILVTQYWYIIPIISAIIAAIAVATKTWKTCYTYWLEMIAFFLVHPYNNRKQKEKRPPKRSFDSTPVLSDEPTISKNLYLNS